MVCSIVKWAAILFALANFKVWPLMFHARFYRIVLLRFYLKKKQVKNVFQFTDYKTYTPFMEMDFNFHKSNSTYFSDMDMSRANLMCTVFRKFFTSYQDPELKLGRFEYTYTPLGSVNLVFRHEIKIYTTYNVRSRVLGWDNKWLFVLSRFERNGRLHAFGISKYVFKIKRKTVPPIDAIRHEGLLTEEAIAQNEKMQPFLNDALDLERVGDLE